MPQLDRYLLREFTQATFATLVVLLMVSLGGIFAGVLGQIARGSVPATMMLTQMGLQTIRYLPLVLPLGLMLGLLLAVGRLYRDAEMPVLASIGIGPRRLLRPLLLVSRLLVIGLIAGLGSVLLVAGRRQRRGTVLARRVVVLDQIEVRRAAVRIAGGGRLDRTIISGRRGIVLCGGQRHSSRRRRQNREARQNRFVHHTPKIARTPHRTVNARSPKIAAHSRPLRENGLENADLLARWRVF